MIKTRQLNNLYENNEVLGAIYKKEQTSFALWAPTADDVKLMLFGKDPLVIDNKPERVLDMVCQVKGNWKVDIDEDLDGEFYNFLVTVEGKTEEAVDPYAKALNVNGNRGMVVNLASTNPEGWEADKSPEIDHQIDSIIYEMHIRDFTIDPNSGVSVKNRGKYLGVIEEGARVPGTDVKTGIEHLKELGVNTIHLMPCYDFATVDEAKPELNQYNWGYDPKNYNAPEGSYSLDPFNGKVRIKEFKEMVKGLHKAGFRVVMDVVYNHTYASWDSNLNKIVPSYYYRMDMNGNFSNGSGCGNEIASEHPMVKRFIVDSIKYWAEEYHIDGFRFDLMGLLDINTMTEIRFQLDKMDKTKILYGEGWTGGWSALPARTAAIKENVVKYGSLQIAAFDDNIRDGIKGHVFNNNERGFINGQEGYEETIKFGVVAATYHSQVEYFSVDSSKEAWANEPYQTVNYASAHDNFTLWDKLQVSCYGANEAELVSMNKLSAAIVFTCQGIPFIQAGEEFARTKVNPDGSLNENSYNSPDSVNQLDWIRKIHFNDLFSYYKGLIKLRKEHKAFRMHKNAEIQDYLHFIYHEKKSVVAFVINGDKVYDDWGLIAVIYNGRNEEVWVNLPESDWTVVVNDQKAGTDKIEDISGDRVLVPRKSAYVLYKEKSEIMMFTSKN